MILFILKKFFDYDGGYKIPTGLRTSAKLIVDLLLMEGYKAKLVEAIDGNCIDRLVTENKPDKVVLEAIWVTPQKLIELKKLHPSIKWTVRVHSEIPFLAHEGMAVQWVSEYVSMGVEVAFNSAQTAQDFQILGSTTYLPNYYPVRRPRPRHKHNGKVVDIGCFGAIRPLKNQLIQAFAAVAYAQKHNLTLNFHMNGHRIEQNGANVLKQIKALMFATGHNLILHDWLSHEDFLELVAEMDICLQVSLSESFNITSADAISMGVPLVGSSAISWLPRRSKAEVNSVASIFQAMQQADDTTVHLNQEALRNYLAISMKIWNRWAA